TMGHLGYLAEAQLQGEREACGNYLFGAYGKDFPTADGQRVMVVGLTGNQWSALRKATGLGAELDRLGERLGLDLAEEGNRFRAREAITALFAPWFAARDFALVRAALDEQG